jgi:hypothetical protein
MGFETQPKLLFLPEFAKITLVRDPSFGGSPQSKFPLREFGYRAENTALPKSK